jgi:hypothetical protein
MKRTLDLSELDWTLTGWAPYYWRLFTSIEVGDSPCAEVQKLPARVPGSVQKALLDAGIVPDWNKGFDSRACEWVENRHWSIDATIPDELDVRSLMARWKTRRATSSARSSWQPHPCALWYPHG